MSQFLSVLGFELAFRRRHPPLWIFTGVCFLFAFLSVAIDGGMGPFGGEGTIAINAPAALTRMLLTFCLLLGLVITTAFVASAVNRDAEYGIHSLFLTTPLRKLPYLFGRFCGAMLAAFLMISGLALGAMLASVMPWIDPERLVPFSLTPYLYGLGVLLFPNLLLIGALSFTVATLTRRLLYAYVALLGLMVIYIVSGNYIADLDNDTFAAISDPFALRTYGYAVRYWTPAELNSLAAPVTRELVLNRLLWGAVSLGLLALTAVRYRMVLPTGGKAGERADEVEKAPEVLPALPRVQPRNDMRAALAALVVQSRSEIRGLVRGVPFLIIALFGALNILGAAFALIERGGTVTLPVTHIMLDVVEGGMAAFMLIVL
ncbi:MAG: ABC transporter permease, partial [Myxococcales bacterium]|nr:ABC transporter permease [Myxococcales bacterium]